MRIGTPDKTQPKGVRSESLLKNESVFQNVPHHVSTPELVQRNRPTLGSAHFSKHHAKRGEAIRSILLESAELVLGIQSTPQHPVKSTLA